MISNAIEAYAQIESELTFTPHIDSVFKPITTIDTSKSYTGIILAEHWVFKGGYYYYTIPKTEHKLNSPYLASAMVDVDDGKEQGVPSATIMPNDDVRLRSDIACNVSYRITGDR